METALGSYIQNPGGALNIEVGGLTPGTEFDRLVQTGALTSASLDGTLNLSIINSFIPSPGQMFTFLTSNARVGQFATVNGLSGLPCDHSFNINYNSFDVTLDTVGGCDDGDPCTDNICNSETGTCEYPLNYDPDTHCCDPGDGTLTVIDDDNVCTEDICNTDGSVDHNDLTPEGFCCNPLTGQFTPLDDEVACTDDTCNPDGSVDHTDNCPDGLLCNTAVDACVKCLGDPDCPAERPFCDTSDSTCKQCLDDTHCHPDIHCDLRDGYCRPDPLLPQIDDTGKNRFISVQTGGGSAGAIAGGGAGLALRVKLINLYDEVECPIRTGDMPDLAQFAGEIRWVGEPAPYAEDTSPPMPDFLAAQTQCCPYFRDWSAAALSAQFGSGIDADVLHIFGKPIFPCSRYDVQAVHESCADLTDENCYSDPLPLFTAVSGDIWDPYDLVNVVDVTKSVDKFRGIPYHVGPPESGAPPKVRVMLRGNIVPVDEKINVVDITLAVDSFRGLPYRYDGPDPADCTTACP